CTKPSSTAPCGSDAHEMGRTLGCASTGPSNEMTSGSAGWSAISKSQVFVVALHVSPETQPSIGPQPPSAGTPTQRPAAQPTAPTCLHCRTTGWPQAVQSTTSASRSQYGTAIPGVQVALDVVQPWSRSHARPDFGPLASPQYRYAERAWPSTVHGLPIGTAHQA